MRRTKIKKIKKIKKIYVGDSYPQALVVNQTKFFNIQDIFRCKVAFTGASNNN
jgi:hypothetical protein